MTRTVKEYSNIDKSKYVEPRLTGTFGQDGWINKDEPALLDNAEDTGSFIYGIALIAVLLGIVAYVVLSIIL